MNIRTGPVFRSVWRRIRTCLVRSLRDFILALLSASAIFVRFASTYTVAIQRWDDKAQAPYLADSTGRMVYTYDTPRSIALKCKFARRQGLAGAMYWDYDGDDSEGTLRKAVYMGLFRRNGSSRK